MPIAKVLPKTGMTVVFQDRQRMRAGHPTRRAKLIPGVTVTLPIDWAKQLSFPMDGNDQYGDCMYAMACHADNTFTGNAGQESVFDLSTIIKDYLQLSGGDNGLDEGTLIQGWKAGLAGVPTANIVDALDIDPTDAALVQQMMQLFGNTCFMLDVPDAWINEFSGNGGDVWDAPARADQNNGHGVLWNGVDASGRYKLQTWGSWVWITPAGVAVCDPSAFVVFSVRWFDPKTGLAPNGIHITQAAQYWQQAGGNPIPASVINAFPPAPGPTPPAPPPSPSPTPAPTPTPPTPPPGPSPVPGNVLAIGTLLSPGTYQIVSGDMVVVSADDQQAIAAALAVIQGCLSAQSGANANLTFDWLKRARSRGIPWATLFQWLMQYGLPLLLQVLPLILTGGSANIPVASIITWITAALAALAGGQPLPPFPQK